MERWEPWVRAYMAIGEMMQGITFQASGNGFQVLASGTSLIAEIERPYKRRSRNRFRWYSAGPNCVTNAPPKSWRRSIPQYAFWSSIVYMHPDRTKRTFELINIVLQFCVYVEMRFKHALACWRPVEYNAQVQPMITTPGHGSFPIGHATQAHAVASAEIAAEPRSDRTSGGTHLDQPRRGEIHFPVDSMAGRMLGVALGEYFVGRCLGSTASKSRTFNAGFANNHPHRDFNPYSPDQQLSAGDFSPENPGGPVTQSLLMYQLWGAARAEWSGKFL